MPREDSLYPEDWLRIAEKDLIRTQRLLEDEDPEAAGFYLEQAIEKFLKAFLLSKGWKLQRTHDLETLINDSLAYEPDFERFRKVCQKVSAFYYIERYPLNLEAGIEIEDVELALTESHQLIDLIKAKMA